MKALLKLFTVILCVISVFAVPCITANAEVGEFKDTLEDNYPLCFEKSDKMRYEKNKDTGETFYEKYSERGCRRNGICGLQNGRRYKFV